MFMYEWVNLDPGCVDGLEGGGLEVEPEGCKGQGLRLGTRIAPSLGGTGLAALSPGVGQ